MKQLREMEIRELLERREFNTALQLARREIAKNPQNIVPYVLAARAVYAGGNLHSAKSFLSQAKSVAPENKDVIAGLLRCAIKEGDRSTAGMLFTQLKDDDSSDLVFLARAEYYTYQRQHNEALKLLDAAHKKFPESEEITLALIHSWMCNDPNDPGILALIDEALEKSKQPEELYQEKMHYLYRRGDYDACSALCRNVARKFPGTQVAMNAQNLFKTIAKKRMENNRANHTGEGQSQNRVVNVDEALAKLDALIGLEGVKKEVYAIKKKLDYEQKRAEALGVKQGENNESYHFVFMGNPGTGKTTVARLIGDIFAAYGILKEGHLVETSRVDLVSQYVGDTAIKTQKVVEQALGGVLFIDEAYSLVQNERDEFGSEAIATLLTEMENNRDKLVVILAGYSREMEVFMDANSGIKSRIGKTIEFPDYTAEELHEIFVSMCKKGNITLDEETSLVAKEKLNEMYLQRDRHFGNARSVRNLYESCWKNMVRRVTRDDLVGDERHRFIRTDIENA